MSGARMVNSAGTVFSAVTLAGGFVARAWFGDTVADGVWLLGTLPNVIALTVTSAKAVFRKETGVDLLALASVVVALSLGEFFVAAVISLMLASGRALEDYAQFRAQREMTALLRHAPRQAIRQEQGNWVSVGVNEVRPGDRLLVRHGEVLPVDGVLACAGDLDESALTGEATIQQRAAGEAVCSGVLNAGSVLEMVARATASESTFAGILRMVAAAQAERSPLTRLADSYALYFIVVALAVAGASWLWSGDALRVLAVLVVATPCPLILGVPVAVVSGLSRCASHGVLVKGGGAMERLARASILFFDKTGTLTRGAARLAEMASAPGESTETLLGLAASLGQGSSHVISDALMTTARERGMALATPAGVKEQAGAGVEGIVDGRLVRMGSSAYVVGDASLPPWACAIDQRIRMGGMSAVFVAVDGQLVGILALADAIRAETPRALRLLRREGFARQAMLTGDRQDLAEALGAMLGVEEVYATQSPAQKLERIRAARQDGLVIMVGDGVNDAPALAAADVGVAMGARGAASASEVADVVLLVDRLDNLVDGVRIARRTLRIAKQSAVLGMVLSLGAMVAAGLGVLPPLEGAILQEAIDVLAILMALRAAVPARQERKATLAPEVVGHLRAEHALLEPIMDRIRVVADTLPTLSGETARSELHALNRSLSEVLVPHERKDDLHLYPDVAQLLGGEDPMAAMSGMHREIFRLTSGLDKAIAALPDHGPSSEAVRHIQRSLYALETVVRLHCAQEDELYHAVEKIEP
ncbi:MAG: heavy metal translocating P-type ATPase [Cupriavidus sp.]|nr:heavy metal translocating P-type ATPase [Cupriavidus sp.]